MADEEVKTNGNEAPEEKKGGSKTIMLISIGVVMIIIAVVLVIFVIFPKYQELTGQTTDSEEVVEEEITDGPAQIGQTFTISNLTINPRGSMGRRFAVFEVVLEFENPELSGTLTTLKPLIMDRYLTYLRTKSIADLSRPTEMDSIRVNMQNIVNELLRSEDIKNLYFTRFVLE